MHLAKAQSGDLALSAAALPGSKIDPVAVIERLREAADALPDDLQEQLAIADRTLRDIIDRTGRAPPHSEVTVAVLRKFVAADCRLVLRGIADLVEDHREWVPQILDCLSVALSMQTQMGLPKDAIIQHLMPFGETLAGRAQGG